jgi:hypothetical protein
MYQVSSGGRFGVGVSGDALVGKKEGVQCKVGAGRRFGRRLGCCAVRRVTGLGSTYLWIASLGSGR